MGSNVLNFVWYQISPFFCTNHGRKDTTPPSNWSQNPESQSLLKPTRLSLKIVAKKRKCWIKKPVIHTKTNRLLKRKDHEQLSWPSNFNHYLDQLDFSMDSYSAQPRQRRFWPKVAWTKRCKNSRVCGKINGFGTPIGTGWDKFIGTSFNDDMINRLTLVRRSCSSFWSSEESNDFDVTFQGTNISPQNGILKMIFLFPRWDMLVPWRVFILWFLELQRRFLLLLDSYLRSTPHPGCQSPPGLLHF